MTIENNSHFERFLAVPWDVVRFKVGTLDVSHQPHTDELQLGAPCDYSCDYSTNPALLKDF
jgi:hypothetical protein